MWTFRVIFGEKSIGRITDGGCYVNESAVFEEILRIMSGFNGVAIPIWHAERNGVAVRLPEKSPELRLVLALCKQCDRTPELSEFWSQTDTDRLFRVRRIREYDAKDLREAEFLTIVRWGEADPIFSYAGRQGERYIGKVAKAKWKKRYGLTYCEKSPRFVNDELRAQLEAEELKGIVFHPVFFDRPEKAKGHFWELGSSITMPPCLLPVVTIPNTDPPSGHTYDDGGHFPKELRFHRAEVAALGNFDVAITREDIDLRPTAWWRELVISQRAYQVFRKLKLTTVAFAPVRLEE
ncbi:MAG: hypothetical protein JNK37_06570 [Verrucomicrobiales bacterium]|nr:hypothetical protein [Verrucomicrobiales bacterium]